MTSSSDRWPDLAVLELLVAVQDTGSIGAAATSVGMVQSNASRALRRLERRVGVPLLVRAPTGTRLTPDAAVLVGWAREVLDAAERLSSGLGVLASSRNSELRIVASFTIAEYLVPGWVAAYRESPGAVQVQLSVANSVQVTAAVLDGSADLGFVEGTQVDDGVRSRPVGRDSLVVIVDPAHPWTRKRRTLAARELAQTRLVVREAGSGTRDALERACARAGLAMVEPAQELNSNAAVRVAAMSGIAPAVLSRYAVAEPLATGRLVEVPVEGLDLARPLRAVWRRGSALTGPARDMLDVCGAGG